MKFLQKNFFLPLERREDVLDDLHQASSPGFDYFLLVVLSCTIATFGLITDSAAVIIGAMLVAPLMSPILGLSLASVAGERRMFQRAALALFEGVLLAIVLSAFVTWIAHSLPFGTLDELPREVAARTRPSPFDLGIALAGGAAAAYALAQPRISAALPGVAIATALMPPLCTVGVGLSLGDMNAAFGAFLLFLTNLTAISFAGIVVFAVLGFRPIDIESRVFFRIPRSLLVSFSLVLVITVPLVLFTLSFVRESSFQNEVRQAVAAEIAALPDSQLVDVAIETQSEVVNLTITVRASRQPVYVQVVDLQRQIAARLQRSVSLQLIVVPATRLDPLLPPTPTSTATLGPSPTSTSKPTATRTSTSTPTVTSTATPTSTASPTVTITPTSTSTPTSTPVLAYINGSGGKGVALRETPAGKILAFLPEGNPVLILYRREMVDRFEWIEVRDLVGRQGWVLVMFVAIRP